MSKENNYWRPTLREAYYLFNSQYFRNTLPRDVRLEYRKMDVDGEYFPAYEIKVQRVRNIIKGEKQYRKLFGRKHTIFINRNFKDLKHFRVAYMVLLHEMVHLKLQLTDNYGGHGHKFQKWMKKIANLGGFNGMW